MPKRVAECIKAKACLKSNNCLNKNFVWENPQKLRAIRKKVDRNLTALFCLTQFYYCPKKNYCPKF
ncbi:hypothetical protein BpHYR1_037141 [Brachionus plicatilis]|uniref:Uncharacterized protein n=1 Tax=Brachionus plicatilis TaxID=10195 RepID=A0A3M7T291_BRAPC|nr:hypothetical protein BpHYR1_037141 [Brachionus plicatilis]